MCSSVYVTIMQSGFTYLSMWSAIKAVMQLFFRQSLDSVVLSWPWLVSRFTTRPPVLVRDRESSQFSLPEPVCAATFCYPSFFFFCSPSREFFVSLPISLYFFHYVREGRHWRWLGECVYLCSFIYLFVYLYHGSSFSLLLFVFVCLRGHQTFPLAQVKFSRSDTHSIHTLKWFHDLPRMTWKIQLKVKIAWMRWYEGFTKAEIVDFFFFR